jgi:hypothetical protein
MDGQGIMASLRLSNYRFIKIYNASQVLFAFPSDF